MSKLLVAAVLSPFLLLGCGSDGADEQAAPGAACSAEDAFACLDRQMACQAGACVACPEHQYASDEGRCTALPGTIVEHTFQGHEVAAGEEIKDQCRSWTLGNDSELFVNAVELSQTEASHHSNWTFVPDTDYDGPDGLWPCAERSYSQLTAALKGGVLYAQSTQAPREVQKFPDGVVVRIPPHSRVISDVHLLNTTAAPVTGTMTIRLYTLPAEQVRVRLAPFHVSYDGLAIPARSQSRFSGVCPLAPGFQGQGHATFDMKVYYLLPHTHALGVRMFVELAGGPNDGLSLLDARGFTSEARGRRWTEPVDVTGADGLRFGCEFNNPRNAQVGWGFGDQEMCEALGFAESTLAFESIIDTAAPAAPEGDLQTFSGDCSTAVFQWKK